VDQPVISKTSRLPAPSLAQASKGRFLTRRTLRRAAILLLGIALVGVGAAPMFRGVASLLIVEDSPEHAAAIVSLGGKLPFREMEAAKLYREGWAPHVIIVRAAPSAEAEMLRALEIKSPQEWELSGEVLRQQGVPVSAIVIPQDEGIGTLEELQAAYAAISMKDAPVILVTSKYHTRRTRLIWNYVTQGRSRPIVRAATGEPFDTERWWQTRRSALAVVREYLGLINYYVGFPITP
jgi:uncharacterized SAM-binding protein YcdF (DUF218 family)